MRGWGIMIEKEIKVILNYDEYKKVLNEFCFQLPIIQTNYYYQSEGEPKDITIRIREKNNKYMLQIKIPRQKEKSLHIKEEYEEPIEGVQKKIGKEKIEMVCGNKFTNDAIYIGKLVTERSLCTVYNNIEMALDVNDYLGISDYELEIEYKDKYPTEIVKKLKKLGIKVDECVEGKNTRFNNRLMEVNSSLVINELN